MPKHPSLLINASNLAHGGGVQVAASLLTELQSLGELTQYLPANTAVTCWASPEVLSNVASRPSPTIRIEAISGRTVANQIARSLRESPFDVEFVVFGPMYGRPLAARRIMGCADVTTFNHPVPQSPRRVLRSAVRRRAALHSFAQADRLVVETPSFAASVRDRIGAAIGIDVVPNTYHSVFDEPRSWHPLPMELPAALPGTITVPYVTRLYPHKNVDFLGDLAELLSRRGIKIRLLLTLRPEEWARLSATTRRHSVNVGPLTIFQVPTLYASADLVIFPSLLEAFSVTPLEALRMGLPLFASDREFVKSVVGSAAIYFDPEDAESAAATIAAELQNPSNRSAVAASSLLRKLPSAQDRAVRYLGIIRDELELTAMRPA